MKVFSFSEARQRFAEVLDLARDEDVLIKRRNGEAFILRRQRQPLSPLDVPGVKTKASTRDILDALGEGHRWPRGD